MAMLKLKKNKYPGKLIVFEGTDGAGKTTLISLTLNLLEGKCGSENILSLKQPTDMSRKTKLFQKMMYSKNNEDIDYRAVQLLTMSDRIQHGFETIIPALKEGKLVICDRYIYTSLANMLARNYKKEKWFFNVAKHIVLPDITFLAYVKPELAIKRILQRPEECDRHLNKELLKNVAKEFKKLSTTEKFIVIDTNQEPSMAFKKVVKNLKTKGII